jgi:signal transduction histidine kinase
VWLSVTSFRAPERVERPVRVHRVLIAVCAATLFVVALVALVGGVVSRRTAEDQAVSVAARNTDFLAQSLVQPALLNGLEAGDPAAVQRVDRVVRTRVLGGSVVRVKIWNKQGRIVYSDEARLIGQVFLVGDEERAALTRLQTRAEVSDLREPENQFERGYGKLLEVHRPLSTPNGHTLLFETYAPYSLVSERSARLWRGFVGITLSSLLLVIVLLVPIISGLLRRLQSARQQREALLLRAVEASSSERRRVGAALHDGIVQELAATALIFAGKAARHRRSGPDRAAEEWQEAADIVRANVSGLRSVLVDLYPANLHSAGLAVALTDLANTMHGRDINIEIVIDPAVANGLTQPTENLIFRVAQECLRNAVKHSQAQHATVAVQREDGAVVLEVSDDGIGFDAADALSHPTREHLGLRLLVDLCAQADASLMVASSPSLGTSWRLHVPDLGTNRRLGRRQAEARDTRSRRLSVRR